MSKYRALTPIVGIQHIDQTFPNDTTQRQVQGTIVEAVDPYWGGGEFIYVGFNSTVSAKALCVITPVFDAANNNWDYNAVEIGNTANLGQMVGVAVLPGVAGQYGWLQIAGITPVKSNAAVAADTSFGIGAAGQAGAVAAGKQILSARIVGASTITKVSAAQGGLINVGQTGGFQFAVGSTDGVFVGAYASGTGIGAAAIVTAIDNLERTVTVSVANTAAVTGNVTFTYNNATIFYNVAMLNRSFAQGAIT